MLVGLVFAMSTEWLKGSDDWYEVLQHIPSGLHRLSKDDDKKHYRTTATNTVFS